MKRVGAGEFVARFSELLQNVIDGETVAVELGRTKEVVALLVPPDHERSLKKRKLGVASSASFKLSPGFKMTEEELVD